MNFFYEGGWSVVKNLLKMVESQLLRELELEPFKNGPAPQD